MKKALKILAALFLLGLLGIAALALYIKVKYPPERVKALAQDLVKEKLHREMDLESLSVGPMRGLRLKGFRLSERPDFKAGDFVSSQSLSVKPFLLPLLKGKVIIKSVELTGPKIRIVRDARGKFNFSDLMSGEGAAPPSGAPAAPSPGPNVSLVVNRISLQKGSVLFEDKSAAAMSLKAEDLMLSAAGFSLQDPFQAQASGRVDGRIKNKPVSGKFGFKGRLALAAKGRAEISDLSIDVLKTSLSASGAVDDFSDPKADITLSLKSFDPKSLAPFMDVPVFMADAQASGKLNLKGNSQSADITGNLKAAAAGLKTTVEIAAKLEQLQTKPAYQARLRMPDLAMENSPLMPKGASVQGPVTLSLKGNQDNPLAQATASLEGMTVVPQPGLKLSELKATLALTQDSLKTEDFKGKFNGSPLALKAEVRNFSRPDITLNGSLDQLDAGALLKVFSAAPSDSAASNTAGYAHAAAPAAGPALIAKTQGQFKVGSVVHPLYQGRQFKTSWGLTEVGPDLSRASGKAEFSAADGKISNLPLVEKINKLIGKGKDSAEISYSSLVGKTVMKNGILTVQDFALDSSQTDYQVKGTVNLAREDKDSDLRVTVKLPSGTVRGSVGDIFMDSGGRPTVAISVKGPLLSPHTVVPDFSQAGKKALESLLDKALGKTKKKPTSEPEAQEAAPASSPKNDIKQLEDAFKGLFKKKK